MATIVETTGTMLAFRDIPTFISTPGEDISTSSATVINLPLTGIVDGAAVQSALVDLGSTFATRYRVGAVVEISAPPITGESMYIYGGFSNNTGAFPGGINPSSISGGAYTGTPIGTVEDSVRNLDLLGILTIGGDQSPTVQIATNCGEFTAGGRYMRMVVRNEVGTTLGSGTAYASNQVVITPIITTQV